MAPFCKNDTKPVINGDLLLAQIKRLSEEGLDGSRGQNTACGFKGRKKGQGPCSRMDEGAGPRCTG